MSLKLPAGEWKREKELGSGGFGVVTLWINEVTKTSLAVKMCRWRLSHLTPKQRARWVSEVKVMENVVHHDNIVSFRSVPDILYQELVKLNVSGLPILTMEYCSMGSLRNALLKPKNACGFLECDVVEVLKDTSSALMYLHEIDIFHRDFKPDNVVLQSSASRSSGVIYKIIDLGCAKEVNSAEVSFVGTLQYLAPEMFRQEPYNKSVDYWSFGITAFEIMCGFRPFLHNFSPYESLQYAESKKEDVICIQKTHTGDIIYSKDLLEEHRLSTSFKRKIVEWLRSVLQYDPQKRGQVNTGDLNTFQFLHNILTTKIITVFSVYTLEYYSYEVTTATTSCALQEWISKDIKLSRNEFFIVPTKLIQLTDLDSAIEYYDETNREAMLYAFKVDPTENPAVYTKLPKLINVLFEGRTSEFLHGTLQRLYAQTVSFVSQQYKNCANLRNAACFLWDHLKIVYRRGSGIFDDVTDLSKNILFEINFYNKIEQSMFEMYRKKNCNQLKSLLTNFKNNMEQLLESLSSLKALQIKQKQFGSKISLLENTLNKFLDTFDKDEFESLQIDAHSLFDEIHKQPTVSVTKASPKAGRVIAKTMKVRSRFIENSLFLNFIKCATNYCNELNEIADRVTLVKSRLDAIIENLREIQIEKIHFLIDCEALENYCGISPKDFTKVEELLVENHLITMEINETK